MSNLGLSMSGERTLVEMIFDQYLTCQIFPVQWTHFPVKTQSRIAQWVLRALFSKDFSDLSTIYVGH